MSMRTRLSALETALENEKREREFYLAHAKRTRNSLGKAMFRQIADDELEHYERLKELYRVWESKGSWPGTVPLKVENTVVKDILKNMIDKAKSEPTGDIDDLAALKEAIDFEAAGASFYARLRDEVNDPKEKAFFNLLADIEHEHYVSLKDTEELLTDPASWFRVNERLTLDG
ncbi:MAG: ferritin family protein [Deltaproteobacteria bacterium]|nr:ferritin family protein [Deltaproteobacteria bacterium]